MKDKPTTQAPFTSETHLTMLKKVEKNSWVSHESQLWTPLRHCLAHMGFVFIFVVHVLQTWGGIRRSSLSGLAS